MKRYFGKRYFCEQCSGILPKGKIVCDKCGCENLELLPELRLRLKRQIIIQRITRIAAVIGLIAILHVNLLFPWQWKAFNNKVAMRSYAKENYPGAKIIGQHYETLEFNPWTRSIDRITIRWNDVEFSLATEDGSYIMDGYWHGVAEKTIYDKFVSPFLKQRKVSVDCEILASDFAHFLEENPNGDIADFDGWGTQIIIRPKNKIGKGTPRELGWLYDFYHYCKENISLQSYRVTLIYPPLDKGGFYIHFTQDSHYNSAEEFYSAFQISN